MSPDTRDTIDGVLIFIPFFALVCVAAYLLFKVNRARHTRALKPLAPFISAEVGSDGNSGFMRGRHGRWEVNVRTSPRTGGLRGFSPHGSQLFNVFEVEFEGVAGAGDWTLKYGRPMIVGPAGWSLSADDGVAEEVRLRVVPLVDAAGGGSSWPTLAYAARQKRLSWSEDIQPRRAPTPEQFAARIELIARIAEINEQIDPRAGL